MRHSTPPFVRYLVRFGLLILVALLLWPLPDSHAGDLADDGRVAEVTEVQGTVLVRPGGRSRWTPLGMGDRVLPGDRLRTQARGAHLVGLELAGKGKLVAGPGTEFLVQKASAVEVLSGELEISAGEGQQVAVKAPGDFTQVIKGTSWLRATPQKTTALDKEPSWLAGYREKSTDEWMGSLLAKVDGRDVPLAVGYHKVDVEIRDQIARTTVEQSFVNSTSSRLEGVFYFPLPADASISGFGMWIGGELVEADIVEKQRARQIYEDILRRKKDPGLLEWEGGNLFKARVFPILPHSEKRIRIRYTQVLPLEGNRMRYRYALRSELLRSKPLRDLRLDVRVVSSTPILSSGSPTHAIEDQRTEEVATGTFTAQEYTPERDFEYVVELAGRRDLAALAHRRDDDGYFMLQLTPPESGSTPWQRDLTPEGDPLDLLVMADTSGSMDEAERGAQAAFLESLGQLLGEKDTLRLMVFDRDVTWLQRERLPVSEDGMAELLEQLSERHSLGWSDLDLAIGTALSAADENTTVLFLGDGIPTTGDADPGAQAARLRNRKADAKATFHAIAPGSTYERGVLEAISEFGGGTVREMDGTAIETAYGLLREVARPSVKDLSIEIRGLRTARVYPEQLPNAPLGMQQIVLGRFLPQAKAQTGEVLVRGMLDGKPVKYSTTITVPAAGEGNSFLPRLWARRHVDSLLSQGGSAALKEEIVTFSRRFNIMTPYTSLLVLESDEDRERYGVERTVKMRDGERFFAEARDKASLEILRKQMRAASRWRTEMRMGMLREVAALGRGLPIPTPVVTPPTSGPVGSPYGSELRLARVPADGPMTGSDGDITYLGVGGGGGGRFGGRGGSAVRRTATRSLDSLRYEQGGAAKSEAWAEAPMMDADTPETASAAPTSPAPSPAAMPPARKARFGANVDKRVAEEPEAEKLEEMMEALAQDQDFAESARRDRSNYAGYRGRRSARRQPQAYLTGWRNLHPGLAAALSYLPKESLTSLQLETLGFPALPRAWDPSDEPTFQAGSDWTEGIEALFDRWWHRPRLQKELDGLDLRLVTEHKHPTRQSVRTGTVYRLLLSSSRWWAATRSYDGPTIASWFDGTNRRIHDRGVLLGRSRAGDENDARTWQFPLEMLGYQHPLTPFRNHQGRITSQEGGHTLVVFRAPGRSTNEVWFLFETATARLIEQSWFRYGEQIATTRYEKYVEIGGHAFPTQMTTKDRKGRITAVSTLTAKAIEGDGLAERLATSNQEIEKNLLIADPLPTLEEAKQARHEQKADVADHLVLTLHEMSKSRWKEAVAAFKPAAASAERPLATEWIKLGIMVRARLGNETRDALNAYADTIGDKREAPQWIAERLVERAGGVLAPKERLDLIARLRPIWTGGDSPVRAQRIQRWMWARVALLDAVDRHDEARALLAQMATLYPTETNVLLQHEARQWDLGDFAETANLLDGWIVKGGPWTDGERNALETRLSDRLFRLRHFDVLAKALERWTAASPESLEAWRRRLSHGYLVDDLAAADGLVLATLAQQPLPKENHHAAWARLNAAIDIALGNGWRFRLGYIHGPFAEPLGTIARRAARADLMRHDPAQQILGNWRFRRMQAYHAVRTQLLEDFTAEGAIESLSLHQVGRYIGWLTWNKPQVETEVYEDVVTRLRARYDATAVEDKAERDQLAGYVLRLLDTRGESERALAFLRHRLETVDASRQPGVATQLMSRIKRMDFTEARQAEVLALLPRTFPTGLTDEQMRSHWAKAARELASHIYGWHHKVALGTAEERAELSRAELKERQKNATTAGREAVVAVMAAQGGTYPQVAHVWLQLERLGYEAELAKDLTRVLTESEVLLTHRVRKTDDPLARLVRERAALVMTYVTTRTSAPEEAFQTVLTRFDEGLAKAGTEADADPLLDWKYQITRLLVIRDESDLLTKRLNTWVVPAKVESRWRIALAYLEAERGRVEPAARLFEQVAALDELGAQDYATLADWYLVLGDDQRRASALDHRYDETNEYTLASQLQSFANRTRRSGAGVPENLDPEALRILRVLMRKSSWPSNHMWRLRNVYRQTKDHRLLESIVDGLPGHTTQSIYAFLSNVNNLFNQVHEEATSDAVRRRVESVLPTLERARDRRALELLLAFSEARAAAVFGTRADSDHLKRAAAALKAAFQVEFEEGEPLRYANLLASMRFKKRGPLSAEQIRQLEAIYARPELGAQDRLGVAAALARVLWNHEQPDRAIDLLHAAVESTRRSTETPLPRYANGAFSQEIGYMQSRRRHAQVERRLLAERDRRKTVSRRLYVERLMLANWLSALEQDIPVSRGRGLGLFTSLLGDFERTFEEDPGSLDQWDWTSSWLRLYRIARSRALIPDAPARLQAWADARLETVLNRLPFRGTSLLGRIADELANMKAPRRSLAIMLDRMDNEPGYLRRIGRDVWDDHHYRLARWRYDVGHRNLGDLEPRLLRVVLAGLEEFLINGRNEGRNFWRHSSKHRWREKIGDFGKTASNVLELHDEQIVIVMRVARFQRHDLADRAAGVSTLRSANEHAVAGDNAIQQLVTWLLEDRLYAEALPLADGLIARHPESMPYRHLRFECLVGLKRLDAARALLKEVEAHWREKEQWNDRVAADLAHRARRAGAPEESVRLYRDAIAMRTAQRGHTGGADRRIADYNSRLAEALGELGQTKEAVDAISAAMVARGTRSSGARRDDWDRLVKLLTTAKDLDAFTKGYEAGVAESGLDAPVLRKALHRAYTSKGQHDKALHHILEARELAETDAEVHRALIGTYDQLGRQEEALAALFGSIRLAPAALDAYVDLARRYEALGQQAQAERALTSLVETTPHQAAGHRRLAELRGQADRHEEALVQWEQVSRTRPLEPTGLLGAARSEIALERKAAARKRLEQIVAGSWEARFAKTVEAARDLLKTLP